MQDGIIPGAVPAQPEDIDPVVASRARDADIVLMRRDSYRYRAADSGNNFVSWSPYDNIELPFRPVATFLRGACVAVDGRVIAEPGHGRFVRPRLPAH